ncbi:SMP-30/gluconolactonase/LRE family protein [Sediminibacterium soli]|uniref:ATP-binding protein n=1 Tax=Sediminibacterium soli TaxID=2698829 RepID=UPI00137AAA7F|nr:ATP-binding protein [Sediminibacterium soli]NCI46909.1 ATP-binding protein [Sediminibacterium soli]
MKRFVCFLSICFVLPVCLPAQHKLEKLWQTDTIVAIPESVLPDPANHILYVSLIDGSPWEADGKGGIGKLSTDGKQYNGSWITGLNAPKGLGKHGNRLYVADISEVVVIDIAKGVVEKKIAIPGATGLNDITVDGNGVVYVSDSRKGNIHRIENDMPSVYLDNKPGVNGLKAIGSDLYIFNGKKFEKADVNKLITPILELDAGGDGIEPVGNGDFILTIWGGYIYYARPDGQKELLLDTHLEKKNTADIGYDAAKKIVYVPTFNAKMIVAYKLL